MTGPSSAPVTRRTALFITGATATVAPGDELPLTPSLQANFNVAYDFDMGAGYVMTPRFGGSYTSSLTFITGSVPEIEQDGYFVGDVSLRVEDDNGRYLQAGAVNVFDERYLIQGNASLGTLGYAEKIFARPRSWYVEAGIEF